MKKGTDKQPRKKLGKKGKIAIIVSSVAAVILIAAFVLPSLLFRGMTPTAGSATDTVTLAKTSLTQSISVSGVVETAQTTNIYASLNYAVKEILVEVGDPVEAGQVLAVLDTQSLEDDLAQAQINYDSAAASAAEEKRSLNNSITNAKNSLASSKVTLEQRKISVANAEKDLQTAKDDAKKPFDSYSYDNTINDALTTLTRKQADYKSADSDYTTARYYFDDYTYQNAITDAQNTLTRKKSEHSQAQTALADANLDLLDAQYDTYTSTAARTAAVEAAQKAVDAAQKTVDSAKNAVSDAESSLSRAKSNLSRAKEDAVSAAKTARDSAEKARDDAQRSYDKALSDKARAEEDYADNCADAITKAENSLIDAKKQLESAQLSVKNAENSLSQAQAKSSSSSSVELQELNLEKLNRQLAQGEIIAEAAGVITQVNATVGASPQGAMFVIDNKDELYVSAKVKEYNLNTLAIGQEVLITTDATGDEVFVAALSYVSPKAVSEAGSTSVEFEVRAALSDPDEAIKIGMNAFLNIVTATIEDVYAVPVSAIVTDERGSFVYAMPELAMNEKTMPQRVELPVTVGLKTSTDAEISGEGLRDGMKILTDPESKLSDGTESSGFGMMPFGGGRG